jgi:uncharacterized protein
MMTDIRRLSENHSNPNVALLADAYARWSESKGASVDEMLAMFADEIEMRTVLTPEIPDELAKVHCRKAEAEAYFRALTEQWEMIAYDVDRFIADEDDIVMVGRCHWRNRATGREIDTPKVDIWHLKDGKAVSFLEMFDSLAFARAIGAI